ncbi:MAG: type II toxin-antitoxin system RelE/ParE family toxin [Kiritimatiellae bacterium]|nr:type II toxin-antitoxin system RelE/ParE family toxin [Kiritimatiellia bacterium]
MKLVWTKRGVKRLQSAFDYIADNFYLDYAIRFDQDARNAVLRLSDNPEMGREAFPEIERPEIRKILCDHYSYWIYYRLKKHMIEILSVRHCLMRIDTPRQL